MSDKTLNQMDLVLFKLCYCSATVLQKNCLVTPTLQNAGNEGNAGQSKTESICIWELFIQKSRQPANGC